MKCHYQGRRKLVHMDIVMCAEMSNSVDGTKCLREPMSTAAKDSKISHGLVPRLSRKPIKSSDQGFQIAGISGFNHGPVDVNQSGTDGYRQDEWTGMGISDNCSDNSANESAQRKCSVEFVSARKYMNPTFSLVDDSVPQSNIPSVPPTRGSMSACKTSPKRNRRNVPTTQKNSLDRYFKKVCMSTTDTMQAVSVTQSHSAGSGEHIAECCRTPENSPRKSVLLSPISKLPGSNNIYYSSQPSPSSTSRGSVTSSQGSSAGNVFEGHKSCASASSLCDDNDDLDFEASFDYIWKTNPQTKRKSAKQLGQSSKKNTSDAAELSKMNSKSVDVGCTGMNIDSTTDHTLQQYNAVSPNMSAENFGLFGFSNNTLLALDSDTDFEDDATDYFSCLPPEVVSNILCRLPFTDLCLNVNRVCLSWKNIIDSNDVSYVLVPYIW